MFLNSAKKNGNGNFGEQLYKVPVNQKKNK